MYRRVYLIYPPTTVSELNFWNPQMETFTREEPCDDIFDSKQRPNGSETDIELDVEAKGSF